MRFVERALNALWYHRRAYAVLVILAGGVAAGAILLATATMMNQVNLAGFLHRIAGLNHTAGRPLQRIVTQAYHTIGSHYTLAWWACMGSLALIGVGFSLLQRKRRRTEITAYLVMGKSGWNIAAQAACEALIAFTLGFWLVVAGLAVISAGVTNWLQDLNHQLMDATLRSQVSAGTVAKIMQKLFAHKVTEFNGTGLMLPHPDQPPRLLAGVWRTYFVGAGALMLSIGVAAGIGAWRTRRMMR
ncbi:hypothetical protein [Lacticaseibacillus nasuensis]|uniref:hypothetical protein n=1 Tax=Lacticaseibacillus nasuensis TaxID=944671 RepID=UPI0022483996|nr:hypothetical protein [Lacticaseibacillus nasuensis]MCX2455408.1 hypothetical protein [Lacticaseibacillus nasuensis]